MAYLDTLIIYPKASFPFSDTGFLVFGGGVDAPQPQK